MLYSDKICAIKIESRANKSNVKIIENSNPTLYHVVACFLAQCIVQSLLCTYSHVMTQLLACYTSHSNANFLLLMTRRAMHVLLCAYLSVQVAQCITCLSVGNRKRGTSLFKFFSEKTWRS